MSEILKKIYQIVNTAVFPPKCLVCKHFFQPPDSGNNEFAGEAGLNRSIQAKAERLLSAHLCPSCTRGLIAVEPPLCSSCGLPFKSRHGLDHPCGECIDMPKKFRIARAPLVYGKVFTEVIHCYKYRGKIQLAQPLGELLLTAFRLFWDKGSIDVIIPVPLHSKRYRKRGFNQSYLLLLKWQAIGGSAAPDPSELKIENDVLTRACPTAPQTGLGRLERAANIKDAFDVLDVRKIIDKRVLLVDDVYTTGATVNECAQLLLTHGAHHVDVLTLARAV